MNELIKQQVSPTKELLQVVHRFCIDSMCYQGLERDDQVSQYQKCTTQLLHEELSTATPDPDSVYTIAANYILVMANAAEAKKLKKNKITFVTDSYDAENAKKMVDKTNKVSDRYEQASKLISMNEKTRVLMKRLVFIGSVVGVLLLVASILFGISSYSEQKKLENYVQNYKPEGKNIFQQFGDWVSHDVFGSPREETELERQTARLTASSNRYQRIAGVLLIVDIAFIFAFLIGILIKSVAIRKSKQVISEWDDYQKLCCLFDDAAARTLGGLC